MFTDIVDLRDFYQSPLGLMAKRVLRAHIDDMWPQMQGEQVLALGYGAPLLRPLYRKAAAVYAFMPAAQGVSYWPREGPNISSLVEIGNLPLADNSVDRVIAMHSLESLTDASLILKDVWRVMKSGGRFLVVIPNRRGLWAHSDRTPFGNGQPYSPSQIRSLLHQEGFLIERIHHALYAPPSGARINLSAANKIEKYASRLFPGFGGVLLVEASKQLYAPPPVASERFRHRLVLPLSLPTSLPGGPTPLPT